MWKGIVTKNRIDNCRVCGKRYCQEPLFRMENMPKSAQHLPEHELLQDDKGVDLEIVQCSGCGLVQHRNDAVPYYRDVIRASAFSDSMRLFREEQFIDFIARHSLKGKKILEIGCGRGEYLSIMQASGADAYGIENSPEAVEGCISGGLRAQQGFIDGSSPALSEAPFDAFFMMNYLEHLPHPDAVLSGISENLANGAVGLIEVPNFDMILRTEMFSEFISDHIFYFTKETLGRTLSMNGFDVLRCSEVWHDYIISAEVKKRIKCDLSGFELKRNSLRKELHAYISRYKSGRVAVWGAGHQALALMALLDLTGKIKYVVDSAPFKQGKYTPATHIPIVPPETLISDPVDAVIVMAASYSDEVANIVREKFGAGIKVSILRDYGLE
jgi:2-polyprenyl-3-methyl-5-hydroxy-6-metoxy-1,4-benzoquinol methylase